MSTPAKAQSELRECLRQLEAKDYFNGGQTVVDRYPRGSEARARLVAEAAFWQAEIARLGGVADEEM